MIEAEQALGEIFCALSCCIIILCIVATIGNLLRGSGSRWIR